MLLPDTLVLTRVKFTCTSQSAAQDESFTIMFKYIDDSGIELSYRPASLCSLAGLYDNPMPELTLSPPVRDYEFGYCFPAENLCHSTLYHLHVIAIFKFESMLSERMWNSERFI
jgi:hypothetical protein